MCTRALRALLALAALRCSAAHGTSGYAPPGDDAAAAAGGAAPVRVGAGVPGVACAASAADLAPLLRDTLEPDVAAWRPGGAAAVAAAAVYAGANATVAPFRMDAFERLVRDGASRYDGERLVLIHNNSWYHFAHARAAAVVTRRGAMPEDSVTFVSPWVSATQWWFEEAVAVWNMSFPGAWRAAPRWRQRKRASRACRPDKQPAGVCGTQTACFTWMSTTTATARRHACAPRRRSPSGAPRTPTRRTYCCLTCWASTTGAWLAAAFGCCV
jgi:hypothetical protein